jgi:hypothetical protein
MPTKACASSYWIPALEAGERSEYSACKAHALKRLPKAQIDQQRPHLSPTNRRFTLKASKTTILIAVG